MTRSSPRRAAASSPATAAPAPTSPEKESSEAKPAAKKRGRGSAASKAAAKDEQESEAQEQDQEPEDEEADEEAEVKPKKKRKSAAPKKTKEPVKPLDPSVPTNLTVPEDLKYEPRKESQVRLSCYNVCGLRNSIKKGFLTYMQAEDADIMLLSEARLGEDPNVDEITAKYPYRYFSADPVKKGYAGVAAFSKIEPLSVSYGLPDKNLPLIGDTSGRLVTLEYANAYVLGTYVVNAGNALKTLPNKRAWNEHFESYVRDLDKKKPVIWGGDINCARTEKDIRNAKTNYNKSAGYTQDEIDGLERQLNPPEGSGHRKLIDVWREKHPDTVGIYSYYSFRFQARTKGIGWRIDAFIVSERVAEKCHSCEIRSDVWGASDHVPMHLVCSSIRSC